MTKKTFINNSDPEFVWPKFSKERDRIRYNTKLFADLSVVEAFEKVYGVKIDTEKIINNDTPLELNIGDLIDVRISRISENGVEFSNLTAKECVVCKNNLYKYKNISSEIFNKTLKARVVDKNRKQTTVDVIQPLFEEWVYNIIKDPTIQYDINNPQLVKVHNLHLVSSGYVGKAEIPPLTELLGEPYLVDAFIPGSHIVLNIEKDFEKWEGQTVDAFVSNYINKPNSVTQKSLVCSRKSYLTYLGDQFKISMYDHYCQNDDMWKHTIALPLKGSVTGIINSSKKCGVFVELNGLNVTGMISLTPEEIVKYTPGQEVYVSIVDFEEMTYYDETMDIKRHIEPYVIEDDKLKSCILKPILKLI